VRRAAIFLVAANACAAAGQNAPVELPVTEPAPPPKPPMAPAFPTAEPMTLETAEPPPPEPEMPKAWDGPDIPALAFADAIKRARDARDAFGRLATPKPMDSTPPDPQLKTWFARSSPLVDQASRMYAAAFRASDANAVGRVDAIAEAAELDVAFVRKLDELGLIAMPREWRSDPGVHMTFEDVAYGPLRRWRDEARALAKRCVDTARESAIATDAARRCSAIRIPAPPRVARSDAGCGCDPGDPLCSASLGGWCSR
jgi:hypothetical protein